MADSSATIRLGTAGALSERFGPNFFDVQRVGDTSSGASVEYLVTWRKALADQDFLNPRGVIEFLPGETNKSVLLQPVRDGLVEGPEIFEISLTNATGAMISGPEFISTSVRDEQSPAGRDFSFPRIENVSAAVPLANGSFFLIRNLGPYTSQQFSGLVHPGGEIDKEFHAQIPFNMRNLHSARELPDGGILLGGIFSIEQSDQVLVRFNAGGALDPDYPIVTGRSFLGFQRSGKAIVQNDLFSVLRLNLDGEPDPTFTVINDVAWGGGKLDADDGLLLLVSDEGRSRVQRFSPDGLLQTNYDLFLANRYDSRPVPAPLPLTDGSFVLSGDILIGDNQVRSGVGCFSATAELRYLFEDGGARPVLAAGGQVYLSEPASSTAGRVSTMIRLTENGEVDDTFIPPDYGVAVAVSSSDKLWWLSGWPVHGVFQRIYASNAVMSAVTFANELPFIPPSVRSNAVITEIMVASGVHSVPERGGEIKVMRIGDTSRASTMEVIVHPESSDRIAVKRELEFEPLTAELPLKIESEDDILPERDGSAVLQLTNIVNSVPGEHTTTQLRIVDDDQRPGSRVFPDRWRLPWHRPIIREMLQTRNGNTIVVGRDWYFDDTDQGIVAFGPEGDALPFPVSPRWLDAYAAGEQSDGKLIIVGELRRTVHCIGRLNPDFSLDSTFRGMEGGCHGIYTLAVQPDDKILIGGLISDFQSEPPLPPNSLIRLLPDGLNDPAFVTRPHSFWDVFKIALQPDGKILIFFRESTLHPSIRAVRLMPNGALDMSFDPISLPNRIPSHLSPPAVEFQRDGKILVGFLEAQVPTPRVHLKRLNTNGVPDESFVLGLPPDGPVTDILTLPNGKIVVSGHFTHIGGVARGGIAQLFPDGSVDPGFDPGVGAPISALILLQNGDLLAGGDFSTFNGLPAKGLVQIQSATDPKFIAVDRMNSHFNAILSGYPGSELVLESTQDLEFWKPVQTNRLDNYYIQYNSRLLDPLQAYRALIRE